MGRHRLDARARRKPAARRRLAIVTSLAVACLAAAAAYAVQSGEILGRDAQASQGQVAAGALPGQDGPVAGGSSTPQAGPNPSSARYLSKVGVVSPAIVAENALPGNTTWHLNATPSTGSIDGWADHDYASAGQSVTLYVSTTASSFHVEAYRMGWYHGAGAREIWMSNQIAGLVQPSCPVDPTTNMVSCANWSPSLTIAITTAFVQGDYLLKLVGEDGEQSYVLLTVWDPTSTATYLLMNRTLTEQGWNTFGGYTFYQGQGPCEPGAGTYPPCNRARVVSFDRPQAVDNGASDFFGDEYPLLRYMEQHGLDVAYVTDVTVDEHPQIVLKHRALLSLGHDEIWTYAERSAAQQAVAAGVNVAFLGAAAIVRHARLQPSPIGADRQEVDYRDSGEDPFDSLGDPMQVTGNTWDSPPTSWPSEPFVGEKYGGYLDPGAPPAPFVVADASSLIFTGTGLQTGSVIPGVLASDFDEVDPSTEPAGLQVLGHSPIPMDSAFANQGSGAQAYSDMAYYLDPRSGALVFDSGTVSWISTLSLCPSAAMCPAPLVQKITGNLLWLLARAQPGNRLGTPGTAAASSTSRS